MQRTHEGRRECRYNSSRPALSSSAETHDTAEETISKPLRLRNTAHNSKGQELWPRMPKQENVIDLKQFRYLFSETARGDTVEDEEVTIRGIYQACTQV